MQLERLDLLAVGDVLLVEQIRPTKHGMLHLPGTDLRKYNIGRVASAGTDVTRAAVGNVIVWEVFKGQAVDHRDDERWFIRNVDVLGVLRTVPEWIQREVAALDERYAAEAKEAKAKK